MHKISNPSRASALHTLVFNASYWQGWPSAEDPYVAPYLPSEGFARGIHRLEPVK